MDESWYVTAFHDEWTALADTARLGIEAQVPSCPGWSIARLVGHLGAIYISIGKQIESGSTEDVILDLEDLELTPEYEAWFRQGRELKDAPSDVVDWLAAAARSLETAFRSSKMTDPIWTWLPTDMTVGFWMRRLTHETAIHRWDVQLAHNRTEPFDGELARDGIDESLTVYQPAHRRPKSNIPGNGETFHFHSTDGDGEWLVRFNGKGMDVTREHAKGDVAIRGPASDLFLLMWHRFPIDKLEVMGDAALGGRYFEFSPPD